MRRRAVATALGLVVVLAGCVTLQPSSKAPPTSAAPPASSEPASRAPSPSVSDTLEPSASAAVAYDESLLAILPTDVDGLAITSTPEVASDVSSDPSVAKIADRYAVGVVNDPVSQEVAVAVVIHLRITSFDETFFRSYRDSFDAAACATAGGLLGNAQAVIGGRQTFIATCQGGAHTYHVFVAGPGVIVSIVSASEQLKLGERLVGALRT